MNDNQIIVGNIGTVYDGDDEAEAYRLYREYCEQSKNGHGRAAGESVTWIRHDETHMEFTGTQGEEAV